MPGDAWSWGGESGQGWGCGWKATGSPGPQREPSGLWADQACLRKAAALPLNAESTSLLIPIPIPHSLWAAWLSREGRPQTWEWRVNPSAPRPPAPHGAAWASSGNSVRFGQTWLAWDFLAAPAAPFSLHVLRMLC